MEDVWHFQFPKYKDNDDDNDNNNNNNNNTFLRKHSAMICNGNYDLESQQWLGD